MQCWYMTQDKEVIKSVQNFTFNVIRIHIQSTCIMYLLQCYLGDKINIINEGLSRCNTRKYLYRMIHN